MAWTRNAWNNFKAQPEIWFFYGLILTSHLSIRKVFFDYPVLGEFNEYSGVYLYLSDIFLGLAIATWVILILYNKKYELSINKPLPIPPLKESSTLVEKFHRSQNVPRGTSSGTNAKHLTGQAWNILQNNRGTFALIFIPLVLVAWSFLSIKWSNNTPIALYRSFKLFEFYLLYLFLALNLRCSTPSRSSNFLRNVFGIIIAVGLLNAIIAIIQVVLQHSVGLFWLKESLISRNLPGVAKVVFAGENYIRAYGLFPHPNILGGFLFLSIILTLAYRKMFYPDTNVPRPPRLAETTRRREAGGTSYEASVEHPTGQAGKKTNYISRYIFNLILGIQIVGGILAFSKSAILGLFLALMYMFRTMVVPRETIKKLIIAATTLSLLIYLVRPDFFSIFIKSLLERLLYINTSLNMISVNLLAGIGSGQFVLEIQRYSQEALLAWQFQPVHNVFLLIWSELGLIGLSLFGWFLWKLFHLSRNVPRGTLYGAGVKQNETTAGLKIVPHGTNEFKYNFQSVLKALLIGFFAIALFDHYLWDIQQGQIMLWFVLGLLANSKINN